MGLKMEDIHTPSVASGQANGQRPAEDKGQKSLLDLISEKENIESEMGALSSVLDSVGGVPKEMYFKEHC